MKKKVIAFILILALAAASAGCGEDFEREKKDWESNYGGGLDRIINIYSITGEHISTVEGKIDVEISEDSKKIKFDVDGKRYIYTNVIAEIVER